MLPRTFILLSPSPFYLRLLYIHTNPTSSSFTLRFHSHFFYYFLLYFFFFSNTQLFYFFNSFNFFLVNALYLFEILCYSLLCILHRQYNILFFKLKSQSDLLIFINIFFSFVLYFHFYISFFQSFHVDAEVFNNEMVV